MNCKNLVQLIMISSIFLSTGGAQSSVHKDLTLTDKIDTPSQVADTCKDLLNESGKRTLFSPAEIVRRFSGETPIALGSRITIPFNSGITFSQQVLSLESIPSVNVKKAFKIMVAESLAHPQMPFREMAAFIFAYEDGSVEVKIFSSDSISQVDENVHLHEISESRILKELAERKKPKSIVHLHTHPGKEYHKGTILEGQEIAVLISEHDYRFYQSIATFFSKRFGSDITILGLVKPVGQNLEDVVFSTEVGPKEKYRDR